MNNKKTVIISLVFIIVLLVAAIVLYFSLGSKKYIVSFNTDGGSLVESQEVEENKLAVSPTEPTKEKHDFLGWYINDELYDFTKPVTENVELTAKWALSDLVMVCNMEDEKPDIATMKVVLTVMFDPVSKELKDASGYMDVTFVDVNTMEQMKDEVKKNFCSDKIDESKCMMSTNEKVVRIEVANEPSIVGEKTTMDDVKSELESGGFKCDLKED